MCPETTPQPNNNNNQLMPRPTDLSYYNWETQTSTSTSTPNFQVRFRFDPPISVAHKDAVDPIWPEPFSRPGNRALLLRYHSITVVALATGLLFDNSSCLRGNHSRAIVEGPDQANIRETLYTRGFKCITGHSEHKQSCS